MQTVQDRALTNISQSRALAAGYVFRARLILEVDAVTGLAFALTIGPAERFSKSRNS